MSGLKEEFWLCIFTSVDAFSTVSQEQSELKGTKSNAICNLTNNVMKFHNILQLVEPVVLIWKKLHFPKS